MIFLQLFYTFFLIGLFGFGGGYGMLSLIQHIFLGLRPGVVGLLAAATLMLLDKENFSSWAENPWQFSISVALFVATFVGTYWLHINPIRMIGYAAFAGLVLLY